MKRFVRFFRHVVGKVKDQYKEKSAHRFLKTRLGGKIYNLLVTCVESKSIILPRGYVGLVSSIERWGDKRDNARMIISGYSQSGKTYVGRSLCVRLGKVYTNTTKRMIEIIKFNITDTPIPKKMSRKTRRKLVEQVYYKRDGYRNELANKLDDYCGNDSCKVMREILRKNFMYIGPRRDVDIIEMNEDGATNQLTIFVRHDDQQAREADNITESTADIVFNNSYYKLPWREDLKHLEDIVAEIYFSIKC